MVNLPSVLTDDELLREVERLATAERVATANLIAHLAEVESRRLYLGAGFPSLFAYCREVLLLPEDAACNRTIAVRMVGAFPAILPMLADGRLNLSTLRLLAPYLNAGNHVELLAEAVHKSKRRVEEVVAQRFPQAAATSIRKLPERRPAPAPVGIPSRGAEDTPGSIAGTAAPIAGAPTLASPQLPCAGPEVCEAGPRVVPRAAQPAVKPMAEDVYLIKLAASRAMVGRLRRAQDLLRHAVPSGDVVEIFDRGLIALIGQLEKRRFGATDQPRAGRAGQSGARRVSASVRREVAARDGERCAYVGPGGRRCDARAFLEFHHLRPYAAGGEATVENMALRCRAHNQYEADLFFAPMRQGLSERGSIRPGAD